MFKFSKCPIPQYSSIWLYMRDSGGDNQDLASQRAYGLAYCEHYHLQIARMFEDSAISGKSVNGRDEFEEMVSLAHSSKRPLVSAILYWDTKRFARNQLDSQFYKADLRRRGYQLVSLSDDIPDNDFAIVAEAFLEWKAQKDREDLAKDVSRGMNYIVGLRDANGNYLGIFPGAPPTFFKGEPYDIGLQRNDGKSRIVQRLIPDPETWELGKRAWEMRAGRASYRDIETVIKMFPENIAPGSTYYHIFRNEIYIGRLHYSGQVYDNFVPALATLEQWAMVQELNYNRPKAREVFPVGKIHPKAGRGDFLLSGLCSCAYCQANIHGSTNRRRERQTAWRYYICSAKDKSPEKCRESKRLAAARIENAVTEFVMARVLTVDFAELLTDKINEFLKSSNSIQAEIDRRQARLAELQKAINNLVNEIELYPSATLRGRLNQRENEYAELSGQINELKARLSNTKLLDKNAVLKLLTEMRATLINGEIRARQLILQSAISKIDAGRDSALVHYQFPLSGVLLERVNWIELNPALVYKISY